MPTNDPHRSRSRAVAPGLLALIATLAAVVGVAFWATADDTGNSSSETGEAQPAADPELRDANLAEPVVSELHRDRVLLELPADATAVTTDAAQLALAYGLADGSIVVRDLHDPAATPKLLRGHPGAVRQLGLGPAGGFVAAGHAASADAAASIVVWNTQPSRGRREPEPVFTLETAIARNAFALAEDGSLLFHASPDGVLLGHDLSDGGAVIFRRDDVGAVTALAFRESPPPVRSTAGSTTRRGEFGLLAIASVSAATGAQVEVVAVPPPGAPAAPVDAEEDDTVGPSRPDWWDPTPLAGRLPARLQLGAEVTSLAFTGTSRRLLIGCADGRLVGWQPGDPTSVRTWHHDSGEVTAVGAWRDAVWSRHADATTTVWRGDADLPLGVIEGGALGRGSRELLIVPAKSKQVERWR